MNTVQMYLLNSFKKYIIKQFYEIYIIIFVHVCWVEVKN